MRIAVGKDVQMVFGGCSTIVDPPPTNLGMNDLWAWDLGKGSWHQVATSGLRPSPRCDMGNALLLAHSWILFRLGICSITQTACIHIVHLWLASVIEEMDDLCIDKHCYLKHSKLSRTLGMKSGAIAIDILLQSYIVFFRIA